jgi:hypothetical protein
MLQIRITWMRTQIRIKKPGPDFLYLPRVRIRIKLARNNKYIVPIFTVSAGVDLEQCFCLELRKEM